MSKVLVKTERNFGDMLVRMKNKYVGTGEKNKSFATIVTEEGQFSDFMSRFGGANKVSEDYAPSEVLESLAIALVKAKDIPNTSIHDDAVINQNNSSIEKVSDSVYTISADFSKLKSFISTDPSQIGEHQWLAIDIATGESTIKGLTFDGKVLGDQDVADATACGLGSGHIVLWMKLEQGSRTILLGNDNKVTSVRLNVVNTTVEG